MQFISKVASLAGIHHYFKIHKINMEVREAVDLFVKERKPKIRSLNDKLYYVSTHWDLFSEFIKTVTSKKEK